MLYFVFFSWQVVETGKQCLFGAYVDLYDDIPVTAEVGSSPQVMFLFVVQMSATK